MNRDDRGALMLIIAGILLFMAVVAYAIGAAEDGSRRRTEAERRERDAAELAEVRLKQIRILESLERIERVVVGREK